MLLDGGYDLQLGLSKFYLFLSFDEDDLGPDHWKRIEVNFIYYSQEYPLILLSQPQPDIVEHYLLGYNASKVTNIFITRFLKEAAVEL